MESAHTSIGMHYTGEKITIKDNMGTRTKWKTLMHEVAHYKNIGHGEKFCNALEDVYRWWIAFQSYHIPSLRIE